MAKLLFLALLALSSSCLATPSGTREHRNVLHRREDPNALEAWFFALVPLEYSKRAFTKASALGNAETHSKDRNLIFARAEAMFGLSLLFDPNLYHGVKSEKQKLQAKEACNYMTHGYLRGIRSARGEDFTEKALNKAMDAMHRDFPLTEAAMKSDGIARMKYVKKYWNQAWTQTAKGQVILKADLGEFKRRVKAGLKRFLEPGMGLSLKPEVAGHMESMMDDILRDLQAIANEFKDGKDVEAKL